ncbi:MAG: hypothetical protein ACF8K1_07015 [Phycisphaerales bacterium JB047]
MSQAEPEILYDETQPFGRNRFLRIIIVLEAVILTLILGSLALKHTGQ